MCFVIDALQTSNNKRYDFSITRKGGLFEEDETYRMRIVLKEEIAITQAQIKAYAKTILELKEKSMLRENKNSFIFLLPINGSIFLLKS